MTPILKAKENAKEMGFIDMNTKLYEEPKNIEVKKDEFTRIFSMIVHYRKKVKGYTAAYDCIKKDCSIQDADNLFGADVKHSTLMLRKWSELAKKRGYHIS